MEEPKQIIEEWEIARLKDINYRLNDYYRDGMYRNVAQMFEDLKQTVNLLEKHMVKNETNKNR